MYGPQLQLSLNSRKRSDDFWCNSVRSINISLMMLRCISLVHWFFLWRIGADFHTCLTPVCECGLDMWRNSSCLWSMPLVLQAFEQKSFRVDLNPITAVVGGDWSLNKSSNWIFEPKQRQFVGEDKLKYFCYCFCLVIKQNKQPWTILNLNLRNVVPSTWISKSQIYFNKPACRYIIMCS